MWLVKEATRDGVVDAVNVDERACITIEDRKHVHIGGWLTPRTVLKRRRLKHVPSA